MIDEIRRIALFTSGVVELTRNRAEQIVKDLVQGGDLRRENASSLVRDMLERSKANRAEIMRVIRAEIRSQIESLGVATSRDVERLERRVARLESTSKPKARAKPRPAATKAPGKKTTRKETTAPRKEDVQKPATPPSSGS